MFSEIETLTPGLAIIGHVKIGMKGEKRDSKRGGSYHIPKKLDHFIITKRERGKDDNFIIDEELTDKIGAKPQELDIKLLYDDIHLNFPHRLACYATQSSLKEYFKIESKSKRCFCTGNAVRAVRLIKDGKDNIECNPTTCEIYNNKYELVSCRPLARLIFVLPEMNYLGGCFDFVTTSSETIRNIKGSLMFIQHHTQGILAGIPLTLKMYAATDETGTGQVKNYKVAVIYNGNQETLLEHARQIAFNRSQSMSNIKRIQAAAEQAIQQIDLDEEIDIGDEFFPPKHVEPKYECSSDILTKIDKLAQELSYNDAHIFMMLGKYKGKEEELIVLLQNELKQKNIEKTVTTEQENTEGTDERQTEMPLAVPDTPIVKPTTPTDKPATDNKFQKQRDELIGDIKEFKKTVPIDKYKTIRCKYPSKIEQFSLEDLRNFRNELEGKEDESL